jgi:hypothetical protein
MRERERKYDEYERDEQLKQLNGEEGDRKRT